ncbi:cob(I)alamin adenosyltransferase [Desulfacinum hydrothermale DSM 13146]|uniref:Corrinoid adenosyltransferase n=1 Tax=Desulfacinum hydrothermale DSM 13146 TaxID=1121390 RepID=A0A1W1XHU8_9BACT|nr:cob(I)yrinic acid a,c-diamide adenosyltransferase [Desulfacinum hydrothermale]SMC23407.1 cob(I)alamin adenosyltransferase [Desulfacinum hydrothermale DSM 13146]
MAEVFRFSKKGDQGQTSLLSGERVSKGSLRPETYGTLDEASSALGLAKALGADEKVREMIRTVQEDLVTLGAELACEDPARSQWRVEQQQIDRLERWIEELQQEVPLPRHFILPGANPVSAALDLARTIVRRAERCAARARQAGLEIRSEVQAYLNRLADFLFTLARFTEQDR